MCTSTEYFDFGAMTCVTCPAPTDAPAPVVCGDFALSGSGYDPTTQRIEIDATGVVQLASGTYSVDYHFLGDAGQESVPLSGAVSIEGAKVVIDLSGQAPASPAIKIVITELLLTDVCGQPQNHDPVQTSLLDEDYIVFELPEPTIVDGGADAGDAGAGLDWVAGCVFEGNF